ncbi:MAG: hypothetical protein AAGK01_13455, partial [Pseudomonadota bacterium]
MPIVPHLFFAPAVLSRRSCVSAALALLAAWQPAHAQESPPPAEEPIIPDEAFSDAIPVLAPVPGLRQDRVGA